MQRIGRFAYADKAEYWAVIWGTFIMGLAGLMIWFKISFFSFLARWWIDIALAIHFYEAVLATLAIIIWHFYHVILDPDVYPISGAWIDGKVTRHQYEEEHALAYEEWEREQYGDERPAPSDPSAEPDTEKE